MFSFTRHTVFPYPPILPIVYYEGSGKWTAPCNIRDRIYFDEAFEPFTPKFFYKPVQLNDYSVGELVEKKDELSLLRHLHLPEDEVSEFTDQVKERDMAVLFEYFEDVDLPAERKKAREEGHAEGRAEGESRFAKLTQFLLESGRTDDLARAVTDVEYRKELYLQYNV